MVHNTTIDKQQGVRPLKDTKMTAFNKEGKITTYALTAVLAFLDGRVFDTEMVKEVAQRLSVPMTVDGIRYGMYVYLNIKL